METFFTRIKDIFNNKSLHSFLLCVFVVLYYYNEIEAQPSMIQPVICIIAFSTVVLGFKRLFRYFNNKYLAYNLGLTFWMLIFFFTMYLINLVISYLNFVKFERIIIPFTILIILGILINLFLLRLSQSIISLLTRYVNVLFTILILFEGINTVSGINQRAEYYKDFYSPDLVSKYNLYILIVDGYARFDNLKKYWNYDNQEFIAFLKAKGFFVIEKSKSNYCFSEQTVCSISSLNYLKKPTNTVYKTNQIFNNPLFVSATKMGYQCSNLGLYPIEHVKNAYDIKQSVKNLYEHIILQTPLFAVVSFYNKRIDRNMTKIDIGKFADLSEAFINKKKNLVLFHSLLTHAPYSKLDLTDFHQMMMSNPLKEVFTWDKYKAQVYPPNEEISPCRDCYLNQLKVTNRLMAKTLENNWGDLSANSVIIVMSDHGFRFIDKGPIGPSNKEAYENFAAIYFPDKDYTTLNDTMTILNSARMCVNKALGTKLSYVKDTSNLK